MKWKTSNSILEDGCWATGWLWKMRRRASFPIDKYLHLCHSYTIKIIKFSLILHIYLFVLTDFLHVQQHLFIVQKNRDVLLKLHSSFIKLDLWLNIVTPLERGFLLVKDLQA